MRFDSTIIAVLLGTFAPLIGLTLAIIWERERRRKSEKPPQTEKLLRPPGYSLSIRLDEIADTAVYDILKAIFLGSFSGLLAVVTYRLFAAHAPIWWLTAFILLLALFVTACVMATRRAFGRFREGRDIRLGMRGEQAVAEALNEAADIGFRSFHDLQTDKVGNIDHVAVGARGVFLIETKARRRRASRNVQAEHEVIYDGEFLQFPFYRDSKPIGQAKMNAKWLSNFLEKKTGEPVWIEPLVVLPGWFVRNSEKGDFPVKVMNANYLPGFLRRQPEKIAPAQVRRIISALDEKCRDVEF